MVTKIYIYLKIKNTWILKLYNKESILKWVKQILKYNENLGLKPSWRRKGVHRCAWSQKWPVLPDELQKDESVTQPGYGQVDSVIALLKYRFFLNFELLPLFFYKSSSGCGNAISFCRNTT